MIRTDNKMPDYYDVRSAFHRKGAEPYSPPVRRVYARSLLKLSDRMFWSPIAALLGIPLATSGLKFIALFITTTGMVGLGMWLRHVGLSILDSNPKESSKPRRVKKAAVSTQEGNGT